MESQYVEQRDGGYWVRGTRVSLDSIVLLFQQGLSPETIATDCFSILSLEEIYGAITFYLGHREEIDAYLRQVDAETEVVRQTINSAAPEVVRRLAEVRRQKLLAGS